MTGGSLPSAQKHFECERFQGERGLTGHKLDKRWKYSAWLQQQRRESPFPRAFLTALANSDRRVQRRGKEADLPVAQPPSPWEVSAWVKAQRATCPFPREFLWDLSPSLLSAAKEEEEGEPWAMDPSEDHIDGLYMQEAEQARRSLMEQVACLREELDQQILRAIRLEHDLLLAREARSASEAAGRRVRLAAMVYRLGLSIGRCLDFIKDGGHGSFADVAFVRDSANGVEVAVKFAVTENTRALLEREASALRHLNAMPGSSDHVIQLLGPYTEFNIVLEEGNVTTVGAILLEKGEADLEGFVRRMVSEHPGKDELREVAEAFQKWEDSTKWLHSNGVLHLDMKA